MQGKNAEVVSDLPVRPEYSQRSFEGPPTEPKSNEHRIRDEKGDPKGDVSGKLRVSLLTSSRLHGTSDLILEVEPRHLAMTLAEFVQTRFVRECVMSRRLSGRTHFQFILRHILTPEQVARAFGTCSKTTRSSLRSIPGWPYLGSVALHDINQTEIQLLMSTALNAGYSAQTVIHIRNVISSIFAHAIKTKHFPGGNPASLVKPPAVVRKASHALTIAQLRQTMLMMRYPEKQIALFSTLTDMNLSEICGLQWKYVNLSPDRRLVEAELLPARTIAIRNQSYRGEFRTVIESRRRFIPIPNMLFSLLIDLKSREAFNALHDFVLVSRRGTAVYPENGGTRRLKAIGRILEIPWLSWSAFHRTHLDLKSKLGQRMSRELEQILPVNNAAFQNIRR